MTAVAFSLILSVALDSATSLQMRAHRGRRSSDARASRHARAVERHFWRPVPSGKRIIMTDETVALASQVGADSLGEAYYLAQGRPLMAFHLAQAKKALPRE